MKKILILITLSIYIFNSCKKAINVEVLDLNKNWNFCQSGEKQFYPAHVPGCVHTDLLANKLIPDPYAGMNEKDLQWIDKKDWIYQSTFDVPSSLLSSTNIILCFKGLDTYADVFLNDSLILAANNMFCEWTVNCKPLLKQSGNRLKILFKSPIKEALLAKEKYGIPLVNLGEPIESGFVESKQFTYQFARKACYQFGWPEWAPRLVTSGIWRPVFLKAWDLATFENIQFINQTVSADAAFLKVKVKINSSGDEALNVKVLCLNQTLTPVSVKVMLNKGVNEVEIPMLVNKPQLWWCNGLGNPFLYDFKVSLIQNDNVIDEKNTLVGIREIKLIQEKDSIGRSFVFEINGIKIFIKGANYIPNDMFPSRVSDETYENIIHSVKEANMNMLRVNGVGIYENDIFYDLCDKNGIMIWQEFPFCCAMYPGDSAFLNSVKTEARQNIERLRNHPCMAVWCGNNEINVSWNCFGLKSTLNDMQRKTAWKAFDTTFNKILPAIVEKYDEHCAYIPTSPFQGDDNPLVFPEKPNQKDWNSKELWEIKSGDVHSYAIWYGKKPSEFYNKIVPRFASEYGMHSFPEMEIWKGVIDTNNLSIESPDMKYRQKSLVANDITKQYMDMYFKPQINFEDFVYISQVMQSLCLKTAIEAHRSNMPRCMGSMYWQLNDCWQGPTFSSIDYSGRWKASHYTVKKEYKNILITLIKNEDNVTIKIVSDSLKYIKGKLQLNLYDFARNILWTKVFPVEVSANTATQITKMKQEDILNKYKENDVVLKARFIDDRNMNLLATNEYYFVSPKKLNLSKPKIKKEVYQKGDCIFIRISTNVFAKNIFMSVPVTGYFSDNNIDLLPNETCEISFYSKDPHVLNVFQNNLKIQTIADTYK
jgi:beta-mannosidase